MLAQIPVVRLLSGQTRAVDAALLTRAHADGLTVLDVADGVGLRVLERDEGDDHVDLRVLGQILVLRDDVREHVLIDHEIVASLLEGDAEHVLVLRRGGQIVRIDLHDVVVALFLGFQDLQRLVGVARGDDAVGHLILEVARGRSVAGVGQRRPVTVGAQAVNAARADVGAGDGRRNLFMLSFLLKVKL